MKLYVHYEGAAKEDTAAPLWTKRITLTPSVATFDDVLRVFCASFAKKFPSQPALTLADIDVWTERNQEMSSRKPLDKDRRAQKWIAAVLHEREGDQVGDCDFELVVVRRLDGTQPPTKVPTGVAIPVVASSSPDPTAKSSSKTSATRNHHHGHCGNSSQHVPDDHKRKEKKQHPMTSQLRVFLDLGAAQMKQHKYRSAKQLYETLILPTEPHNPEALIAIGDIHASNRQFEVAAAEWYMKCWQTHSARPCRDRANAKLAFESGLKVVTCEIQLKKYRQALEMIEKLQLFLRQESKCCGIFVPVDSSSTEKEEMEAQMDFLKAQTLYEMHASSPELQETAIALLMHLLPDLQDPNVNLDALLLYAKVAYDRGKRSEALSMALRVLVSRSSDRRVKKHLAAFLKDSEGVQRLQQVVPPESESSAAAYAFIGTILKDFGAIESSVACFEQALRGNPSCPSYALNHAHVLEVDNRYESAYAVLISFFRQNASLAVAGALTAGAILKALEMDGWESRRQAVVPTEKEQWRVEWTAKDPGYATVYLNGSVHHDRKTCGRKRSLSEQELDLLACFFTIVKILFLRGRVSGLPRLISLIEPVRIGKELHRTTIRNEQAYYSCIAQLLSVADGFAPPATPGSPPKSSVYVCGDSHTLATAWREVTLNGRPTLLHPALVTGLKHWHLRKDSVFYPKINFWRVLEGIPPRSKVVFLFGEIDCREGILVAVEKCKYESIEEGMDATIRIFMEVLADVVDKYEFEAFIHPVVPVLNETRQLVIQYNEIFKKHVRKSKVCKWLDFFDDLVYDSPDEKGEVQSQCWEGKGGKKKKTTQTLAGLFQAIRPTVSTIAIAIVAIIVAIVVVGGSQFPANPVSPFYTSSQ